MLARLLAIVTAAAITVGAEAARAQTSQHQAPRSVALVIGQSKYLHASPLPNTLNDATAMASTLRDLGFEVIATIDAGKSAVEAAAERFIEAARAADVSFLYYAGHAIQFRGANYVVPIDARTTADVAIEHDFISLTNILERLEAAAPAQAAKLIVLDACRDNPWEGLSAAKSGQKRQGLAPMARSEKGERDAGLGQGYFRIVAFSTAAGHTASDGQGRHSPYTQSLLRRLPQQGLEVGEIFRDAAADVQRETNGVQRPEYLVQTSRPLYLRIPYVTDCDRVAIEGQNFLGIAGVPFDDIDAKKAVPACEAALKQLPDSARLHNNMGRAYEKAERLKEAHEHYRISAEAGYAPAINALGIMKIAGCGLPGPQLEEGIKLIAQARALGNLSARASLTSHDLMPYVGELGVRKVQEALARAGFYKGRIDGKDDKAAAAALASFQESRALARKGLTLETVHALELYDIVPRRFRCH